MAAHAVGQAMVAETMSYIACDVPEGMQLCSWRAAQTTRRSRRTGLQAQSAR